MKSAKIWALAVLVVAAIAIAAIFIRGKPQDAADEFIRCLCAGNYARAYDLLYREESSDLLTKKQFIRAQQAVEKAKGAVKEYRIRRIQNSYLVTYQRLRQKGSYTMTVRNAGTIIRPVWRLYIPELYAEYGLVLPQVPCAIIVDGTVLKSDEGKLSFVAFKGLDHKVVIKGPDIKTVNLVLDDDHPSRALESLQVNDKLQAELEKVADGFSMALVQAIIDGNIEHVKPFLKKSPSQWEDMQTQWNSVTAKIQKQIHEMERSGGKRRLVIVKVRHDPAGIDLYGAVTMKAAETLKGQTTGPDGDVQDQPAFTETLKFSFERQPDGKWLIKECLENKS